VEERESGLCDVICLQKLFMCDIISLFDNIIKEVQTKDMLHFIVNVRSGKGRGNRVLKKIVDYCYKHGIVFNAHITGSKGHAVIIAQAICQMYPESTIVAVGGDGTFHEILNGIADLKQTTVGFIPAGRGNDYARAIGLSKNPIKALEAIVRGDITYVDYLEVSGRRCLNVAGSGLDVAVLNKADGKEGKITYLRALLHCLKNFDPYKFNITANGETTLYDNCIMVGVCNGTHFGAGLHLSPQSKVHDGKLNVVVIRVPQNGKLLAALTKFAKGKHLDKEFCTHIETEEVNIIPAFDHYPIELDGEIYNDLTLQCKIIAGGMKTFNTQK